MAVLVAGVVLLHVTAVVPSVNAADLFLVPPTNWQMIGSRSSQAVSDAAVGDLNGDGKIDLAVAIGVHYRLLWVEGDGAGSFVGHDILPSSGVGSWTPRSVAIGHLNNDPYPDLVVDSSGVIVLSNDGSGTFTFVVRLSSGTFRNVGVADVDNDGKLDIIGIMHNPIPYWYKNDDNTFSFTSKSLQNTGTYVREYSVSLVDINNDGRTDIAFRGDNNHIIYALHQGTSPYYGAFISLGVFSNIQAQTVGDVNGDSFSEFVLCTSSSIFINFLDAAATAFDATKQVVINQAVSGNFVNIADIDDDSDNDIILIAGSTIVWLDNTDGTGSSWTSRAVTTSSVSGNSFRLVYDVDGDGYLDSVLLTIDTAAFPLAAGSKFAFSITPENGGSTSTLTVTIGGVAQRVTDVVFDAASKTYTAMWTTPENVGSYSVTFGIDGNAVATLTIPIKANVVVGAMNVDAATVNGDGQLEVRRDSTYAVHVKLEDAFGNPVLLSATPGTVVPILPSNRTMSASLTLSSTSAVAEAPILVVARSDGNGYDAVVQVSTVVVGAYTLEVVLNGVDVPGSPVEVLSICPVGTSLESGTTCATVPCNANSVRVETINATVGTCHCQAGFYAARRDTNNIAVCESCPRGGVCAFGLDPPVAQPGYYATSFATFHRCLRQAGCVGGDAACADGYDGYMCNTCSAGFYSNAARECVQCPESSGGIFAGAFTGLVACAVAVAGVVGMGVAKARGGYDGGVEQQEEAMGISSTSSETLMPAGSEWSSVEKAVTEQPGGVELRRRTLPATVSQTLVVLQVLGILGTADFSWSSSSKSTLEAFNVANIDVNLFASECTLGDFHTKYAISVGLPMIVLVVVGCVLVALHGCRVLGLGRVPIKSLLDAALFAVAPLIYIPMARATFVILDCTRLPNGEWVMDADPGVACFDSRWSSVAWLGVVVLCVFVLGVPGYFLWCVVRHRTELLEASTFARYGALYKLYRVPYYWGGVAELVRRLAIVVAAVFVSAHILPLIASLIVIFTISALTVARTEPYFYPLYNSVEFQLNVVLMVVLFLGAASYAERNVEGGGSDAIFVGVVLIVVAMAIIALRAIVTDVLQILRERRYGYNYACARAVDLAAHVEREMMDLQPSVREPLVAAVEVLRAGSMMETGVMHHSMAMSTASSVASSSKSIASSSSR
ncbi:uncharacterized protein AMSG_04563 [Thecamonas trahens ATCC 50062]|uniref:Tyrosine-protein kinase ephrin type A/B receptor-like domain-containing protein n=1 Tax=Thecamonas trahens ATCC 50062 TaxID=461836 RepID=A0A0L0D8C7_THETB|nr:hypothetical protein AMSG_04563 [Thecamonas trahens ATCC 50062]KNC48331.1 hypothetical protein AMSG_04563 [Thecamonas trahens ATCC 50062]|eukprot:XP_013758898.1 hypothetical protein AMSG_04563 [Thecamonas trahens ATCC 50062]